MDFKETQKQIESGHNFLSMELPTCYTIEANFYHECYIQAIAVKLSEDKKQVLTWAITKKNDLNASGGSYLSKSYKMFGYHIDEDSTFDTLQEAISFYRSVYPNGYVKKLIP